MNKEFVQEVIDPRETVVKVEKVTWQKEPEPKLIYDKIWVPSAMKDWARKEAENLLVLGVMRFVAEYPTWLVATAESFEEKNPWQVAANF